MSACTDNNILAFGGCGACGAATLKIKSVAVYYQMPGEAVTGLDCDGCYVGLGGCSCGDMDAEKMGWITYCNITDGISTIVYSSTTCRATGTEPTCSPTDGTCVGNSGPCCTWSGAVDTPALAKALCDTIDLADLDWGQHVEFVPTIDSDGYPTTAPEEIDYTWAVDTIPTWLNPRGGSASAFCAPDWDTTHPPPASRDAGTAVNWFLVSKFAVEFNGFVITVTDCTYTSCADYPSGPLACVGGTNYACGDTLPDSSVNIVPALTTGVAPYDPGGDHGIIDLAFEVGASTYGTYGVITVSWTT